MVPLDIKKCIEYDVFNYCFLDLCGLIICWRIYAWVFMLLEVLDKMFLIVVLFESVAMNFRFEFPLFIGGRDVIGLSCREQLQIYYSRHALGQNCLLLFFIKYNDKHFLTQNETSNINFNSFIA